MKEIQLKYGCNPNQKPSRIYMADGSDLPVEVLNGRPGYINFLDALNSWQLVKELKEATGMTCAASFKHVSPTSAALGLKLSDKLKKSCFVENIEGLDDSPLACAYARARGTDRMSSFGDFIALSDKCDLTTAKLIKREVSDGVIAPDYDEDALKLLKTKKNGAYNIIRIDENYKCAPIETKQVFGISFEQGHNDLKIDETLLNDIVTQNKDLPDEAKRDLIVALITLKYTQSNSVAYAYDGQAIGVGAGQQSRIHCTRLAGNKADTWFLRMHDKVLNLPFRKELGRADIAEELRSLAEEGAVLRDFIRCILTESYYYSGSELSVVSAYVMNIDSMSESERLRIEADGYCKIGKLDSALRVYFDILGRMETENLSEAFYARIAYSIGVIYARLFMGRNANSFFGYAYELYPDPSYARACVYMALINNDEEELLNTIIKYNISDDTLETVRARVGALRREIETSEETVNFIYDFENGINSQKIIDNWKEEYYERTS